MVALGGACAASYIKKKRNEIGEKKKPAEATESQKKKRKGKRMRRITIFIIGKGEDRVSISLIRKRCNILDECGGGGGSFRWLQGVVFEG